MECARGGSHGRTGREVVAELKRVGTGPRPGAASRAAQGCAAADECASRTPRSALAAGRAPRVDCVFSCLGAA